MQSPPRSPVSSPSPRSSPADSSLDETSVPPTPTQPVRRLPAYEKLAKGDKHNMWVHYCTNDGEWMVGFIIDTEEDHVWLIPFGIRPETPRPHPHDGSIVNAWLYHGPDGEAFGCLRVHRRLIVDFYRMPSDLEDLRTLQDLSDEKFHIPFHAPHYPLYLAAQVANRVACNSCTPMNIVMAATPQAPRKRSFCGVPLRPAGTGPAGTPAPTKKIRTEPLRLNMSAQSSPVSKSMDTK